MLDKVTEMVAHMIGIFHTTLEDGRMRDSYLKTHDLRKSDPDTAPMVEIAPTFKAPYQLEDFLPRIRYEDMPRDMPKMRFDGPLLPNPGMVHWAGLLPDEPVFHTPNAPIFAAAYTRPVPTLEPPGAVVTITFQSAFLADNDLLRLNDAGTVFVDPAVYDAQLVAYQHAAQAIAAPIASSLPALGLSVHDHALSLYHQIGAIEAPGEADTDNVDPNTGGTNSAATNLVDAVVAGATVTVLHGDAAFGAYENGVKVAVATKLDDVMPAYLAEEEDPEAAEDDTAPNWAPSAFEGLDAAHATGKDVIPDHGHELVTGANVMINQTNIGYAWLDAPVIAVMGDVISLNIISQANMLVQHGEFGGAGVAAASASYNTALISVASSAPQGDVAADVGGPMSLPYKWAVTRIDGDLLTVNQVQQYSFVTDHDRADVGFYSASSYITLGGNMVINLTDLLEIGYGYDLIIIGGNMITINQISQMNVLIDNDAVTYSGIVPTAFSAGDNLLYNGASISVTGIDSYQAMQGNYQNAANGLAAGGADIGTDVTRDAVFEGIDILRVLYISGDATTINLVNQNNILGDSDQVHLALDNFQSATGAEVTVTTGSNALINLASISQFGVDSQVSVGGEVYSDAMLYQAGFLDSDADPLGVALPALANEAVAFLADDMLTADTPDDMSIAPTQVHLTSTQDVMQGMLA